MMKLMLGKRIGLAWRAFCRPNAVFFRTFDIAVMADFPDMPEKFQRVSGPRKMVWDIEVPQEEENAQ